MQTKEELEGQLSFLHMLPMEGYSTWEQEMWYSLCEDVQDKLDGLNGVVAGSLQSPKLSDGCVEDVQASGLPNQPKPGLNFLIQAQNAELKTDHPDYTITRHGVGQYEVQDVHTLKASEMFRVPYEDVTTDQRYIAKVANDGIAYGKTIGLPTSDKRN